MLGLQLVPVHPAAVLLVEDRVAGVEVQLGPAGDQPQHHVDVRHQLLRRPGPAGIVAGGLNAAGQGLAGVRVKATDVVSLPAVERNRNTRQSVNNRFCINTYRSILFFCKFIFK